MMTLAVSTAVMGPLVTPSYSVGWASLVAQLVKNQPVMQEIPVPFWGWKDPLEKG